MVKSAMIDCLYPFEPSTISKENRVKHPPKILFEDPVDQEFFDLLGEKDSLRKRLMKSHIRGAEAPQPPAQ
jgi:hypothetical protein